MIAVLPALHLARSHLLRLRAVERSPVASWSSSGAKGQVHAEGAVTAPFPPGPPARPLTGHVRELGRHRLGFFTRCAREYGDAVPLRLGPMHAVLLSHPDLIEQVLVAQHANFVRPYALRRSRRTFGNALFIASGPPHRRRRRIAQPAFHHRRIPRYAGDIVAETERALATWRDGQVRDVHNEMAELTLAIVGRTLFGVDVHGDASSVGEAMTVISEAFATRMDTPLPLPDRVPTPANLRSLWAVRRLERVVFRLIEEARAGCEDADHLLALLVHARDGEGNRLSAEELRDDALGFLLAGHETTALALTWSLYLLAQHPDAARRLRAEVEQVAGGHPVGFDDVPRLIFAGHILREAMRLYPPVYAFGRESIADCDIGGYRLPAGWSVIVSQWVVHRDPRFFADPDAFEPERWVGDLEKRLPRFAYFPFGGGPHQCIGAAFAQLEATLVLATIAQRFALELAPGHVPELLPEVTLRPRGGLPMTVRAVAGAAAGPALA